MAAVREQTSLVVQLSTGGSVHDGYPPRLRVLDAEPDSCSLTCGTVNFGDDVFMNPWPFMVELYQVTQRREVVPEFELFDLGHVTALNRLLDSYGAPYGGQVHCDLVMNVPGGMPGTAQALVAAVAGPSAGRVLVGHRHRPFHADGDVCRAGGGGTSAGRHGGCRHLGPRRAGPRQRPVGRTGGGGCRAVPASADVHRTTPVPCLSVKDRRGAGA